jgi:hypothetical protein
MGMTAPCADGARPPGLPAAVPVPETTLHTLTEKTDLHERTSSCNDHQTLVRRNSTYFLRAKTSTTTTTTNATLHWKYTHYHQHVPPELIIMLLQIQLVRDFIACNSPKVLLHVRHLLQCDFTQDITPVSWLETLAFALLPPEVHPTAINVLNLPTTTFQLPYARVSDIKPPQRSVNSRHKFDQPYWNVIYDPTMDQLQVYATNRVTIYRRQRHSRRFVYLQGKAEATFPMHATIAIGHWENDYFVLMKHTSPPTCRRPITAGLHVISALPSAKPRRTRLTILQVNPRTAEYLTNHDTRCPITAGLHVISALPPAKPRRTRLTILQVIRALSKVLTLRYRPRPFPSAPILCNRIPPLAGMLRRHLALFFAIAEVILEQNVDPG